MQLQIACVTMIEKPWVLQSYTKRVLSRVTQKSRISLDCSPSSLGTSPSLLSAAKAGQRVAWERLVAHYRPRIRQWCRIKGLDEFASAEVEQETLMSVAQSLCRFKSTAGAGAFRAWLWKIVQRRIADFRIRQSREPRAIGGSSIAETIGSIPQTDGEGSSDSRQLSDFLQAKLKQIEVDYTPRAWLAFLRSVVDGRPTDEVALEFQMTPAGVRQIRSRILRHLRDIL